MAHTHAGHLSIAGVLDDVDNPADDTSVIPLDRHGSEESSV